MISSGFEASPQIAAIKSGRLSHAYITTDKSVSDMLAAAAVCTGREQKPCGMCRHCGKAAKGIHPDIIETGLLPDKREIVVDQIRALKEDVIIVPNEAAKKAYVIKNADAMNPAAQNAFLRILEEPPRHAVFILAAQNPAALLATVRSRCVEIKAVPSSAGSAPDCDIAGEFIKAVEDGQAAALAELSFRIDKLDRRELAEFIEAAREMAAEKLRESAVNGVTPGEHYAKAECVLHHASEYLDRSVGTVHISGLLLASLI